MKKARYNFSEKTVQSNFIAEYDCLRVIATLLVVLGHCTYFKISTNYGGIDYSTHVLHNCIALRCFQAISGFLYIFHMPLFMALSGALFYRSIIEKKKYKTFIQISKDKGKRLLFPFLIVSLFYSFPLKFVSGYYVDSKNIFKDFLIGQLMVQGNTHLWYLLTLFFIFIIFYEVEMFFSGHSTFKLTIFGLLCLCSSLINIKLLSYIAQYSFWFYVGYCFEPKRKSLNNIISIPSFFKVSFVAGIVYCLYHISYTNSKLIFNVAFKLIEILVCGICILSVYMFSYLVSRAKLITTPFYSILQRNSFGIYLYSDSWNYVILFVSFAYAGEKLLINNGYAILIYAFRFFTTLIISIAVTEFVRKLKLKYLF